MESVLYLCSPADELLRGRISGATKRLRRVAIQTLEGINVKVPDHLKHHLEMRKEQTYYHYEPRKDESITTLWGICDDLHRLNAMTFKIENSEVKRELQEDIHALVIGLLRLLHWA